MTGVSEAIKGGSRGTPCGPKRETLVLPQSIEGRLRKKASPRSGGGIDSVSGAVTIVCEGPKEKAVASVFLEAKPDSEKGFCSNEEDSIDRT